MCTIDWNALGTWLGAIATFALAILTFLTLRKVREYTESTDSLVKIAADELAAARDQQEASITPFIAVGVHRDRNQANPSKLYISNCGSGVALNVTWLRVWGEIAAGHCVYSHCGALAVGDQDPGVAIDVALAEQYQTGIVEISYQSLSSRKYRTIVKICSIDASESRQVQTHFERVYD